MHTGFRRFWILVAGRANERETRREADIRKGGKSGIKRRRGLVRLLCIGANREGASESGQRRGGLENPYISGCGTFVRSDAYYLPLSPRKGLIYTSQTTTTTTGEKCSNRITEQAINLSKNLWLSSEEAVLPQTHRIMPVHVPVWRGVWVVGHMELVEVCQVQGWEV